MSSDKYTVTFRGAERKYRYVEKGEVRESKGGHLWYVLHKNGEQVLSAGFHSVEGEMFGAGEVTNKDEEIWRNLHKFLKKHCVCNSVIVFIYYNYNCFLSQFS